LATESRARTARWAGFLKLRRRAMDETGRHKLKFGGMFQRTYIQSSYSPFQEAGTNPKRLAIRPHLLVDTLPGD